MYRRIAGIFYLQFWIALGYFLKHLVACLYKIWRYPPFGAIGLRKGLNSPQSEERISRKYPNYKYRVSKEIWHRLPCYSLLNDRKRAPYFIWYPIEYKSLVKLHLELFISYVSYSLQRIDYVSIWDGFQQGLPWGSFEYWANFETHAIAKSKPNFSLTCKCGTLCHHMYVSNTSGVAIAFISNVPEVIRIDRTFKLATEDRWPNRSLQNQRFY